MRRFLLPVLTLAFVAGVLFVVGRAVRQSTEARVRAEMRDSVAFEAASAFREARDSVDRARDAMLAAERKLTTVRTTAQATLASTGRTADSLRAVLAHSVDTIGTRADTVRQVAETALAQYDSLSQAFRNYLRTDSTAHATADSIVKRYEVSLAKADTALRAMTQARDAWRKAADCRVVGMRCPTRTQVFVAGLVTGAVVVLAR